MGAALLADGEYEVRGCGLKHQKEKRSMDHLSEYQEQALYLLLATSLLDFIATLWIRFAVNRRTLGIDASSSPL